MSRCRWALLAALAVAGCSQGPRSPGAGAPSASDDYFPGLGNGGYDVLRYLLALDFDPASDHLEGLATIASVATQDLSAFNLDLTNLTVSSVAVNGESAAFQQSPGELTVTPARPLAAGTRFSVDVAYSGDPEPVRSEALGGAGWVDTDSGSFALNEPNGASGWFPVNDHPSDKALFAFEVTVPAGYTVAANGRIEHRIDHEDGRTTFILVHEHPMASYLATVNIGDFTVEEQVGPGLIPIRDWFPSHLAEEASFAFRQQPEMMAYFSSLFGPYPSEAYDAILIDVPLGLALEPQTASLFGSDIESAGGGEPAIARALAYQWFGAAVTPSRWRDIWLNEGFATYAQWLWAGHDGSNTVDEVARNYTHTDFDPPGDPGPDELFGGHVNIRGALTLHALRLTIGDEAFFSTLQTWVAEHRDGNATTGDFIALAEAKSGQQLDDLFHAWLYAPSQPDLPG